MAMDVETSEELCPAPLPACPDWLFDVRKGDLDERVASRTTASGRPEPFLSLSFPCRLLDFWLQNVSIDDQREQLARNLDRTLRLKGMPICVCVDGPIGQRLRKLCYVASSQVAKAKGRAKEELMNGRVSLYVWQEDLVNTHNVLNDLEIESQSRKEEVCNLAMTAEALLQQLEDELQDAKDTTIPPEKEYVANLEELVDQLVHEKDFFCWACPPS